MELVAILVGFISGLFFGLTANGIRRDAILENASEQELIKHLTAVKAKRIAKETAENQARKEVANL